MSRCVVNALVVLGGTGCSMTITEMKTGRCRVAVTKEIREVSNNANILY